MCVCVRESAIKRQAPLLRLGAWIGIRALLSPRLFFFRVLSRTAPPKPISYREVRAALARGSTSNLALSRILAQLGNLGLAVKKEDADGNCLFRAIARRVCGDPGKADVVRWEVVQYMRLHPRKFLEHELDVAAYTKSMAPSGAWGDQPELAAACELYGLKPAVYEAIANGQLLRVDHTGTQLRKADLMLLYDGKHYESLTRLTLAGAGEVFE